MGKNQLVVSVVGIGRSARADLCCSSSGVVSVVGLGPFPQIRIMSFEFRCSFCSWLSLTVSKLDSETNLFL